MYCLAAKSKRLNLEPPFPCFCRLTALFRVPRVTSFWIQYVWEESPSPSCAVERLTSVIRYSNVIRPQNINAYNLCDN